MSDLLAIYRHALRARLLDERLSVSSRAGHIGFHPDGQQAETVIVAATLALSENDWVFPTARDHAAALTRGVTFDAYLDHVVGNARDALSGHAAPGCYCSREKRIAPPTSLLSQHLTQAMGLAWALKLRKEDAVVLALLPETAADAGDFHSAVNFAGVTKAPIVFVVRTDGSEAPAPDVEVSDKGIAYAVPCVDVSGDPLHVLTAVRAAAALARRGEGPTLIEARVSLGTDSADRTSGASRRDPLSLVRQRLIEDGAFTESDDMRHRRELLGEIEAAFSDALASGVPPLDSIFEHVHAELPPHLVRQREELRALHPDASGEPA